MAVEKSRDEVVVSATDPVKKYKRLWASYKLLMGVKSIDGLVAVFEERLEIFKRWRDLGVTLDPARVGREIFVFFTLDPSVAEAEDFAAEDDGDDV